MIAHGHNVESLFGEDRLVHLDEWPPQADLFLLKGHDALCLGLAGLVAAEGGVVLNPYRSCVQAENKILATRRLRAAGVPAPETWVTTNELNLVDLVNIKPLIIKPHIGGMGRSRQALRVNSEADLRDIDLSTNTYVIQEFVSGSGMDLKIYVVGDRAFGIRKPSTGLSFNVPGVRCDLAAELVEMARRVGDVLGLGLFGIDVVESPEGPFVVDVNYFPSYAGIEEAPIAIADYIDGYARGQHRLMDGGQPSPAIHIEE